jgi:hypothetical protein
MWQTMISRIGAHSRTLGGSSCRTPDTDHGFSELVDTRRTRPTLDAPGRMTGTDIGIRRETPASLAVC